MSNPTTRSLALVTGGSSGIGLEPAQQFAEHGYDVVISGKSGRMVDSAGTLRLLGVEVCLNRGGAATHDDPIWRWSHLP